MQGRALIKTILVAVLIAMTSSCTPNMQVPSQNSNVPSMSEEHPKSFVKGVGIDLTELDKATDPCGNFFGYVNDKWFQTHPMPPAEVHWGSWTILREQNRAVMRDILEEASRNAAPPGSNQQKVGDFYASAMDSVAIDKAGLSFLQPELKIIADVRIRSALAPVLARQQKLQAYPFIQLGIGPDDKNSTRYAVFLTQNGLSIEDQEYYLQADNHSKAVRTAFRLYLINSFAMLGDANSTAQRNAETVLRLETRLARASRKPAELRDPQRNYNKMTLAEAARRYPNLQLPGMLRELNLASVREVIVGQPEFMQEVNVMLQTEPLADVKTYLRWRLVRSLNLALPESFGKEAFRY